MVQAVLFQEVRFEGLEDWPTDAVVMATYSYLDQMEDYSQFVDEHPFLSLFITPPTPPLIMKYDCSTGLGQVYAATAIAAYNWYYGTDYDTGDHDDLREFWEKLQNDEYNIEMIALVLAYKLSYTGSYDQAMKAYNGSNDDAERYRLVTMKYYEAFKKYNSSCGE